MKGNEALAALWEALDAKYVKPPDGSTDAKECAKRYGISRRAAKDRLEAKLAAGELEAGYFMVGPHKTRFYWLPKKGKKREAGSST